jgi:hypothetical protein
MRHDNKLMHALINSENAMWVLEFEAPKGTRCHRYFDSVTCMCANSLWWSDEDKKWVPLEDIKDSGSSNCGPVRTLKAFKRHLRKHPELKGRRVTLASRYHGQNVHAEWHG